MDKSKTEIVLVIDKSGSMSCLRQTVIKSVNAFLKDQKDCEGTATVTMYAFDDEVMVMQVCSPLENVPELSRENYEPGGCTALLDAVGIAIDDTGKRLASLPEEQRPANVIIGIMTDGFENSSRRYKWKDIADRIAHQREKYSWRFMFFGAVFGSLAGYFGGAVDNIIMRIVDVFAAIPGILMGIVIVAALGASTGTLMLAVGISSAPSFVRVTRAAVMTTRNSEYVQAAKSIGLVDLKIIFTHVLPNCISPIIVQATLKIANAIVSAAGLSFLGMGIPVPAPEWGSMLADGRNYIRQYSYMCLWPGVAIMVVVLAFNLLGDGLRDAMDPKLRK